MTTLTETLAQVRAAQAGDRAALEALFARYQPRVLGIVAVRLGRRRRDCAEIEDIAQNALLNAFRGFDRFTERSEGTFLDWLARIVENAVTDYWRRGAAQKRSAERETAPSSAPEPAAADPRPSQVAQGVELEDRIEAALLAMDERDRELIVLRERCEMEYADIAERLGLKNADTARALHHRALRGLAAMLEG